MNPRLLLRSATRGWVFRKKLPKDLGGQTVFCTPEAMLATLRPGWAGNHQALGLFDWVRRFVNPGMMVWDVGANQGLFAVAAAARVGIDGSVIAFEPDLFLAYLIDRSVAETHGDSGPVMVLPIALAGEFDLQSFSIAATDRALNHLISALGNPHTHGSRRQTSVICLSGDKLAERLGFPEVIKIDVEGAEVDVLYGCKNVISAKRPIIIVEVAPENTRTLNQFFTENNYALFDVSKQPLKPSNSAWNTLAVPNEKVEAIKNL